MSALLWFTAGWLTFGTLVVLLRPSSAKSFEQRIGATLAILANILATVVAYIAAIRGLR